MRVRVWLSVLLLPAAVACFCCASAVAADSPGIASEQARAQRVLAEVQQINLELGRAAEAWDGARYHLAVLERSERMVRSLLREARRSARVADRRLARVLVAMYESDQPSAIDVIVGATSMGDVITRLDDEQQVAAAQTAVVRQVVSARARVQRRQARLSRQIAKQRRLTGQLSARRSAILVELSRRQRLLQSIRSEVAVLKARAAARERALARQARLRFARELARQARLAQQLAALRRTRLAAQAEARRAAKVQRAAEARRAAQTRAAERARAEDHAPSVATPPRQSPPPPAPPVPAPDPLPSTHPAPPPAPPAPVHAAPAPPPPSAAPAGGNTQVVSIALRYLGVPYRWGGASPQSGFDCSGLVMYVFAQVGISLPHFAAAQYRYGTAVARDQLQPGDLVFFDNLNHVGIYIGNGQFEHAPHTGDVVRISSLGESWYTDHYVGARRIT